MISVARRRRNEKKENKARVANFIKASVGVILPAIRARNLK
jgi:hypothetical protein